MQATLSDWTHVERSQQAYERHLAQSGRVVGLSVGAAPTRDYPSEVAYSSRLWLAADGRFRPEKVGDWDGMTLTTARGP